MGYQGEGYKIYFDDAEELTDKEKSQRVMTKLSLALNPETSQLLRDLVGEHFNLLPQFGTFDRYVYDLKRFGIWRAMIITRPITLDDLQNTVGYMEIHVPKTSLHKMSDFVLTCTPFDINVVVKEMKNPLKWKKGNYLWEERK
jgi:hypothetical protein